MELSTLGEESNLSLSQRMFDQNEKGLRSRLKPKTISRYCPFKAKEMGTEKVLGESLS